MKRLIPQLVALLLPLLTATAAFADDYVDYDPQSATPNVSAPLFVIISYSAIWLLLVAFAIGLWRHQRKLSTQIDELNRRLGNS